MLPMLGLIIDLEWGREKTLKGERVSVLICISELPPATYYHINETSVSRLTEVVTK